MPQLNANDALIGRRLGGRVEIRALVGAGGMGRVYRGWHLATNAPVAVKVLSPRPDQPALAKRLNVEVVAARRLRHPNVVHVIETGVDPTDNVLYVVMEYVEGKDLGYLLRDGRRLPIPRACAVLREVLAALEEAHALNVLHRDIKPGNIMLTRSREPDGGYRDQVKVVDFGLAKLSGEATSLTETGFVAGTPGFMAPEQAMGEDLDGRADVYACGATLYRMLSGQMPFKGERLAAVLRAMKEDPAPIAGLPPELDRVLRWSLARERSARCPSARAFAGALAPFAEQALRAPPGSPPGSPEVHWGPEAGEPGGLRLDAALGIAPSATSPPPPAQAPFPQPTLNQRASPPAHAPAPEAPAPEAPRAMPFRSAFPAPVTPAYFQEVPAGRLIVGSWWIPVAALALGLGAGIYGTRLVLDSRRDAAVEEMTRQVAFGQAEEAEQALFGQLDRFARSQSARRLAYRLLELRQSPQFPLDPGYRLGPATFEGISDGHKFALEIAQVSDWSFEGTLEWTAERTALVEVKGIWRGNELLFVDTRVVRSGYSSYAYNEAKLAFAVQSAGQVQLIGYDGPKRRPLVATRQTAGPSPSAEKPAWADSPELAEADLRAYFAHRARSLVLERDALDSVAYLAAKAGPGTSEQLEEAWAELRERGRRLAGEAPLPRPQMEMLDEIVGALFRQTLLDGRPALVPHPDEGRLEALRAKYGPVVDRVRARQGELFTGAPRPSPDRTGP